jgi:cytochrome c1
MVENDDKSAAIQIGVIVIMFMVIGVILVIAANIIA